MQNVMVFTLLLVFVSCQDKQPKNKINADSGLTKPGLSLPIQSINNIQPPEGYKRLAADGASFATWLRNIPLKKERAVYLYNGKLKPNQSAQFAVVDISVGKKDLQQCADVVMRLRAEYLFAQKKYGGIGFVDYSGR